MAICKLTDPLGLIPGVSFNDRPPVNLDIKQPNVDQHINFMSEIGKLTTVAGLGVGPSEHVIDGADINQVIAGSDHASLDNPRLPDGRVNQVWSLVEQYIRRVVQTEKSVG